MQSKYELFMIGAISIRSYIFGSTVSCALSFLYIQYWWISSMLNNCAKYVFHFVYTACAELSRLVNGDYGRKRVGNGKCLNEKRLTWLDKFAIYCCRYIAWVVPVLEFTWNEVLAVLTWLRIIAMRSSRHVNIVR